MTQLALKRFFTVGPTVLHKITDISRIKTSLSVINGEKGEVYPKLCLQCTEYRTFNICFVCTGKKKTNWLCSKRQGISYISNYISHETTE